MSDEALIELLRAQREAIERARNKIAARQLGQDFKDKSL